MRNSSVLLKIHFIFILYKIENYSLQYSQQFSSVLLKRRAKRKYKARFPGWRENTGSRKRYIDRVWERWGSRLTEEIAPLAVSFVAGGSGCRGVADTSVYHGIPRGMIYKAVGTEENDAVITGPGTRCCNGCSGARQPGLARSNASSWLPSLKNLSSLAGGTLIIAGSAITSTAAARWH